MFHLLIWQIYRQENVEKRIAFGLKRVLVGSSDCRCIERANGLRINGAEGVRCMRVLTRFANSHTKCNTAKRPPAAL